MEHVRGYELKAFFSYVIEILERLEIPYMVVGGFAAIFYGEPQLTIDVDIVVDRWSGSSQSEVAAFVTGEKRVCCTKEEAHGGRMGLCPNDHRVARN
jgi:hypothetical protein